MNDVLPSIDAVISPNALRTAITCCWWAFAVLMTSADTLNVWKGVAGESVRTQGEFYRKLWSGRSAGAEVPLRLLQGADVRELEVRSIDRVEYFRPRTFH